MNAGYSKRTLAEKLGIKRDTKIVFINHPVNYSQLLGRLPSRVLLEKRDSDNFDLIQMFVTNLDELKHQFPILKKKLKINGTLWMSWPKGSSSIKTDLNENIIREIGLHNGLVDVKVIAVDQDWSGLKFVYRLIDRQKQNPRLKS